MVSAGESEVTHADIESQIAAFFANGGKIQEVPAGQRAETVTGLNACRCGCHGDYTEHSMRAGESGRYSSEIVR